MILIEREVNFLKAVWFDKKNLHNFKIEFSRKVISMACPINNDEIAKLKMFIQFASAEPSILNLPQLSFLKNFVESLGGKVPEQPA